MQCPTCGEGELVHATRDLPYTCQGEMTVIPAVTGDWCTACDKVLFGVGGGQRASVAMLDFNKPMNAASKRAATR